MYLPDENNAPIRMQVPLSELNQQMEEVDPNETAQKPAETAPAAKPAETQPAPDSPADEPSGQISFDGARTPAESEVGALLAEPEEAPPEETAEAPAAESPPAPAQEAAAEPPAASVPAVRRRCLLFGSDCHWRSDEGRLGKPAVSGNPYPAHRAEMWSVQGIIAKQT